MWTLNTPSSTYAGPVERAKGLCSFFLKAIYGYHEPTVQLNKVEEKEREVVPELKENEALIFTLGPGRKVIIVNDPKKRRSEYIDLLYDNEKTTRVEIKHMPAGTSYFRRMIGFFNTHYKTQEVMLDWRVEKIELSEDGVSLIDLFRESANGLGTTSFFSHEEAMHTLSASLGETISSERIRRRTRNEHLAAVSARSFIHGQKIVGMGVLAVVMTLLADKVLYQGRLLSSTNIVQTLFPVEYSFQNPNESPADAYKRISSELKAKGQYAQAKMIDWLSKISETGFVELPNQEVAETIQLNLSQIESLPNGIQMLTLEAAEYFSLAGNNKEVELEMIKLVKRGHPVNVSFLLHVARNPINREAFFDLLEALFQSKDDRSAQVAEFYFQYYSSFSSSQDHPVPERLQEARAKRFPKE